MSIIYVLIARNVEIVLCEYSEYNGNFQQITRNLLKQVKKNGKQIIEYDNYKYQSINQDNITYLCMTSNFPTDVAFAFLMEVQKQFNQQYEYEKIITTYSYGITDFQDKLQRLMEYYNKCPQKTQTGQIIKDLNDAKAVLIENIENLMDRDHKMNLIVSKSEQLNTNSSTINKIVNQVKNKKLQESRNTKMYLAGGIILIILLLIIIF